MVWFSLLVYCPEEPPESTKIPPHVVTLFLNGLREEQYEKVNYYQVENFYSLSQIE